MSQRRIPAWFGALLFLVALAAPVVAGAQCWFTAAPDISFGSYDPTSPTPDDASGTFGFQCSNNGRSVEVSLSIGAGTTYAQRQMTQGTSRLDYNLYTDAACSILFGDGTGGTATRSLSRLKDGVEIQIFGRIPIDQWVAAGLYYDNITITIDY